MSRKRIVSPRTSRKNRRRARAAGHVPNAGMTAIQRIGDLPASSNGATLPDSFTESLGPGQPLDAATLGFMETRFGPRFQPGARR
jgi:hypothetical protein